MKKDKRRKIRLFYLNGSLLGMQDAGVIEKRERMLS